MISTTSTYDLLGLNTENTLLQDTRLVMICTGLTLAIRSGNPLWAQSNGTREDFERVYHDYFNKIQDVYDDVYTVDNEFNILNKAFNIIYMTINNNRLYRSSKASRDSAINYLRDFAPEFTYADMLCGISKIGNLDEYIATDSRCIVNRIHRLGYTDDIRDALNRVQESGIFKDTDFLRIAKSDINALILGTH